MKSPKFSFETRAEELGKIGRKTWDLLVIGGGITGAAAARDASLRGFQTLLVESRDFASGTSSGSSKLVHGGVRYLQQYEFGLVYHAIREREKLKSLYYPFVRDIDFVFPTYKSVFPPRGLLNLGLSLYDAFSFFKKRHHNLSRDEMKDRFPYLRSDRLTGGIIYQDSFTEDYRLVVEIIKSAVRTGAQCFNRLKFVGQEPDSSFFRVKLYDEEAGREIQVIAKKVLNCAGPFSDEIKSSLKLPKRLHLTQGVHFVFSQKALPLETAFVLPDPENRRILFGIPWHSCTYLGTTDTDIRSPLDAKATKADVDYVLGIANRYFSVELKASDIIQSWAAVRPLIEPNSENESNSEISREHEIEEKPEGFFHILGGKLTSHRLMAEQAIDLVADSLGSTEKSKTEEEVLHSDALKIKEPSRLQRTYGVFADDIVEIDHSENLNEKRISRSLPHLAAEVLYAINHEMALHPLDFLRRRSSVYYESSSPDIAEAVCELFKKRFSWTSEIAERKLFECFESYRRDQEAFKK